MIFYQIRGKWRRTDRQALERCCLILKREEEIYQRYIDLLDWSDTDWYTPPPQMSEMEEAETWAAEQKIFDAFLIKSNNNAANVQKGHNNCPKETQPASKKDTTIVQKRHSQRPNGQSQPRRDGIKTNQPKIDALTVSVSCATSFSHETPFRDSSIAPDRSDRGSPLPSIAVVYSWAR